jgi:hypothetical protein
VKSAEVATAVRRHFGAEKNLATAEWSALAEFSLAPGGGLGRIDLMLVRNWGGGRSGHERIAVEIKVSRSDLRSELANPWKRAEFEAVCDRFYFACPKGLCDPADLPDGIGLLEVTAAGVRKARVAKKTPRTEIGNQAFVEAFRRAARAEALIRAGADDNGSDGAGHAALAKQVTSLTKRVERSYVTTGRERRRADLMRDAIIAAAPDGVWCQCGEDRLVRNPRTTEWRHASGQKCRRSWPYPNPDTIERQLIGAQLDGADQAADMMPLAVLQATWRPGSRDDPNEPWTWADEAADLWARDADLLTTMQAKAVRTGELDGPVLLGHDGRVWDGHHRITIAAPAGLTAVPFELAVSRGYDTGEFAEAG